MKYIKAKYALAKALHYQLKHIRPKVAIKSEFYSLSLGGLLIAKAGYGYDGPSGPTIDTKDSMFGSLIHDVLYEMFRKEQLSIEWRADADDELSEICKLCGMRYFRAELWEKMVYIFAGGAASPENKKIVYEAPSIEQRA